MRGRWHRNAEFIWLRHANLTKLARCCLSYEPGPELRPSYESLSQDEVRHYPKRTAPRYTAYFIREKWSKGQCKRLFPEDAWCLKKRGQFQARGEWKSSCKRRNFFWPFSRSTGDQKEMWNDTNPGVKKSCFNTGIPWWIRRLDPNRMDSIPINVRGDRGKLHICETGFNWTKAVCLCSLAVSELFALTFCTW